MKYAIWVREHDAEREVLLCRVGTNPHPIAKAARRKMLRVDLGLTELTDVPKYEVVRVEEI